MSQLEGDEAIYYVADDYEMAEVDDDMYFRARLMGDSESDDDDDDEYDHLDNKITDTTAADARRGKDIQGIPWERLSITREKYRQTRLEQYKNYENIPQSGEGSEKECKPTKKGGKYYEFWRNTRSVKSTILHFQLRNLVWSTSKHDVYLMSHFSIVHWSSLSSKRTEVLDVSGHVAPCEKHPGNLLEGFTQTQVSTLAVRDNLLIAGGFQGELICKYLDQPGVSFCSRTTYDENAITNAVEIYNSPSGGIHFMASNNDCGVRDFDMERFQLSKHFSFPWPVNHTSLSPDGKLLVIVGDNPEGILVDSQTGKAIMPLCGHLDFSFASAWHPDGRIFATGNQDKTCRVWDVRNLSKSVAVLKGNLGAIRSIRFTSDGNFMAMAEPADFVHVYDAKNGFESSIEFDPAQAANPTQPREPSTRRSGEPSGNASRTSAHANRTTSKPSPTPPQGIFVGEKMPLGLILGIGRAFRRKRTSSLDILSSKRAPRDYYKGKNCKSTGFHTRKGGYVLVQEKLPNFVVPDLTDFKLKSYVSQCPREVKTAEAAEPGKQ